jgi:RNA binding exosome subunit
MRKRSLKPSGSPRGRRSVSEGFHGNKIIILHAEVKAAKKIRDFFHRLETEDIRMIQETLELRVDEDCTFYLRLDKQKAFLGQLVVLETGDVISINGKIKSYPKRRETAMLAAKEFFEAEIARRTPDE